jgi:hypothetical protein
MDLLDDLGTQLRALSADQPAQPGDRVPLVTRRARHIQRTRAAVAVAAVLAIAVPAAVVVSSAQRHEATQFGRSDVTTWPDRSPEGSSSLVHGAVASLERTEPGPVLDVRPLYASRVTVPEGPAYVAVFIGTLQGKRVLVAANSFGHQLDAEGRSLEENDEVPWDTSDRLVLDPARPLGHVGVYLPVVQGDQLTSTALVLADPAARFMTWRERPLPYAPAENSGVVPTMTSRNGVFLGSLGAITGYVDVSVQDRRGRSVTFPLASGASRPALLRPQAPDLPSSWDPQGGSSAQTEPQEEGRWAGAHFSSVNTNKRRPMTVYARCYGGGRLDFALLAYEERGATSIATPATHGAVSCDGATHRAFAPRTVSAGGYEISVASDRLQAYNYQFGYVG